MEHPHEAVILSNEALAEALVAMLCPNLEGGEGDIVILDSMPRRQ